MALVDVLPSPEAPSETFRLLSGKEFPIPAAIERLSIADGGSRLMGSPCL